MTKSIFSIILVFQILCGATLTFTPAMCCDEEPSPVSVPVEEKTETSDYEKDIEDDVAPLDYVFVDKCYYVAYGWNLALNSSTEHGHHVPNASRAPPVLS